MLLKVAVTILCGGFDLLLMQALTTRPVKMLGLTNVVLYFFHKYLVATERGQQRLWAEQYDKFGSHVPYVALVLLLGLVSRPA